MRVRSSAAPPLARTPLGRLPGEGFGTGPAGRRPRTRWTDPSAGLGRPWESRVGASLMKLLPGPGRAAGRRTDGRRDAWKEMFVLSLKIKIKN